MKIKKIWINDSQFHKIESVITEQENRNRVFLERKWKYYPFLSEGFYILKFKNVS